MMQDLQFAFRRLRRSPGFAVAAVLTLALGIGANTAVFNLVQSVLLAPLPYSEPDRIVAINTGFPDRTIPRLTFGDYNDIRSQATDFSAVAYYYGGQMGVQTRNHATFVSTMLTNSDFAQVFSARPVAGRFYGEQDAKTSAVVSQRFAEENFGSAPSALEQTLSLEGQMYTIVGVLPTDFDFPKDTQVWLGAENAPNIPNRDAFNIRGAVAKLKPGVSLSDAQAQMQTIGQRLQQAYPETNKTRTFPVMSLQEQLVSKMRPALLLLEGAVALVLLIACVNVAHLQLARATTRVRELAVRSALGANRWQVARQVIAESVILCVAGCVLGVLIAGPILRVLLRVAPTDMLHASDVHLNFTVLAFAAAACAASSILSGAAPVWQVWRTNLVESLKQDSSRGLTGRSTSKLRSGLVIGEVALTFVLAIAGGLLGRTLYRLTSTDPGFRGDHLLVVYAHAPANGRAALAQKTQEFERLYGDLGALPGVQRVAGVMGLPTGQYGSNGKYMLSGQSERDLDKLPDAIFSLSSPGYFSTLSIPVLRGRDFSPADSDGKQPVAIVSESLARESFQGEDPIGKLIRCGLDEDSMKWMTIVGVVADVRQDSLASKPGPALYMPLAQHPFRANEIEIVLRTTVAPDTLTDTVQKKIRAVDPEIATKFTTMHFMLQESISTQRFRALLIGSFAALGLVLAMIGVYGVMEYVVAQRTFEVGVRLTFGADPADIRRLILKQAMNLSLIGMAIGFVLSILAVQAVSSMLFGVPPRDPATFLGTTILLLATAGLAAYLPARRAAAVDPMKAIRTE